MASLDPGKYQDDDWPSLEWDRPFHAERPATFSPAAESQDDRGRNSMLWFRPPQTPALKHV